jgi:hypothetical protein
MRACEHTPVQVIVDDAQFDVIMVAMLRGMQGE